MMKMPYTVNLANMSEEEQGFWGGLFGIESTDVKDQTEVTFEIASFLALPPFPVEENILEVVIKDNSGNSLSKTLTIIKES